MKFGKKLRRLQTEAARYDGHEWAFISYKALKKMLHQMATRDFAPSLRHELHKVNLFFLDKQHELAQACARAEMELRHALGRARTMSYVDVNALKGSLIALHAQFVQLELFSTLNFAGFRKILKKYDKKHGTKLKKRCLCQFKLAPFFAITYINMLAKGVLELIAQLERFGKFRRLESANLGGTIAARHSAYTEPRTDVIAAWASHSSGRAATAAAAAASSASAAEVQVEPVRVGARRSREFVEAEDGERGMARLRSPILQDPAIDEDKSRLRSAVAVLTSAPGLFALFSTVSAACSMETYPYVRARLMGILDAIDFASVSSHQSLAQDLSRISVPARLVSTVLVHRADAMARAWPSHQQVSPISIHFVYIPAAMQLCMISRNRSEVGYLVRVVAGSCSMVQFHQEGSIERGEVALHHLRACDHAHGVWPAWSFWGDDRHHKIRASTNCLLVYVTLGGLSLKPTVTFEDSGRLTESCAHVYARRGLVQRLFEME